MEGRECMRKSSACLQGVGKRFLGGWSREAIFMGSGIREKKSKKRITREKNLSGGEKKGFSSGVGLLSFNRCTD